MGQTYKEAELERRIIDYVENHPGEKLYVYAKIFDRTSERIRQILRRNNIYKDYKYYRRDIEKQLTEKYNKTCLTCGKSLVFNMYYPNKKYCNKDCFRNRKKNAI
jgi:hypothetical protein